MLLRQKAVLEKELQDLKDALEKEKRDHQKDMADLDSQKLQATEALKADMQNKIQETKANLKALNEEQVNTTTRLTTLQNHQLTTELDYQSK